MARDVLLGLGLALSPATQFRIGGLPLGVGELLLCAWLLMALAAQLAGRQPTGNPALRGIAVFWSLLALAESLGLVSGFARELFQDVPSMLHDIFAYLLMLALGTMLALEMVHDRRRERILLLFTGITAATLLAQFAGLVPGVESWYFDRFRGWSENPNQIGFFTAFVTFVALHLVSAARSAGAKGLAVVCLALAVTGGLLSRSDSFVVAALIGSSVWVAITALVWIRTLELSLMLRGAAVLFALLSVPLAAAAFAPFAEAALERIEQSSESLYSDNDQGETRLNLWREALERGVGSGFLGFGPGPQLTSKSYKRPPPDKFEAHNTLLDLFAQGGLLAVGTFVWLCLSALLGAWRARLPAMAALVCALVAFSMFHFVVRQPIFWFGIVLCLLEAARELAALRATSWMARTGAMR